MCVGGVEGGLGVEATRQLQCRPSGGVGPGLASAGPCKPKRGIGAAAGQPRRPVTVGASQGAIGPHHRDWTGAHRGVSPWGSTGSASLASGTCKHPCSTGIFNHGIYNKIA